MAKKKSKIEELVESLAGNIESPDALAAAVAKLQKKALERMLEAEMEAHLGYEKHAAEGYNTGNSRNGRTKKTVTTDSAKVGA